jgi:hypothetical protein
MGMVANADPQYVGDYQKLIQGLYYYPGYEMINSVFGQGESMFTIRDW